MPDAAVPIAEIYARMHRDFPERAAIRDDRVGLTFAELGSEARKFANALRAASVPADARVVMIAPNSCEWVVADHGLALGGYTRVGVLPRLHAAEVAQIAADIDPSLVIVDSEWLADNGADWIPPQVKEILVVGDETDLAAGHAPFAEFVAAGEDAELPVPPPDSTAWVMYTSGSTGLPKGVLASQRSVGAMVRNGLHEVEFRSDDVALHTAPISHFSGTIHINNNAVGGLNVLKPSFEVGEVIAIAEAGEVTVLPLVPTMITMVVEELGRRGEPGGAVGAVRMIPYAGSAIQPDRAARAREFFGDVMTQFYGASESPLPITVLRPEDHVDEIHSGGLSRLASAGRPAHYVDVKVIDPEGVELGPGEQGEIKVGGEQVAPGYWRQPEATAEVFEDGYVRTGDVGYIDEQGFLFILDRRKDMIITGGFNVYPREVENAISTLAGVREVAVVGAPDERWGEVITAVIAPEPGAELDAEAVIAHCRNSIGGFKVPKRVEFVEELPKSGVGKILKVQIREELWADRARRV
ncbi:MAG: AMP-binding protein [Actinobacteria bacterium]|nr:AMP-binding protein [Actinomycetota bacterium]